MWFTIGIAIQKPNSQIENEVNQVTGEKVFIEWAVQFMSLTGVTFMHLIAKLWNAADQQKQPK